MLSNEELIINSTALFSSSSTSAYRNRDFLNQFNSRATSPSGGVVSTNNKSEVSTLSTSTKLRSTFGATSPNHQFYSVNLSSPTTTTTPVDCRDGAASRSKWRGGGMHWDRVSYGCLSFFLTSIHNIFLLYHVEVFVSVYKVDKLGFWLGELIFLAWNSVNDPLFGWLSDRGLLSGSGDGTGSPASIVHKRIRILQWNGPLLAAAFLLVWLEWHWAPPAFQFVFCLCLYDSFLTLFDLHHSALLADLAVDVPTRATLNMYSSVGSACGSLSVFLSYLFWDSRDMSRFRLFCSGLFVFSVLGFLVATQYLRNRVTTASDRHNLGFEAQNNKEAEGGVGLFSLLSTEPSISIKSHNRKSDRHLLVKFTKQMFGQHNFVWFSLMHLIQVFHCHFNSNFFPLFIHTLLSSASPTMASFLMGMSFVLPHINNLYFLNLCKCHGAYIVVRWLFVVKLALAVIMVIAGMDNTVILCIFIASNRIFTEGTCKLLNLIICDLVDEDFVLRHRTHPVSALIFGSAAFVAKPGQTLAPVVGIFLLTWYTGYDIFTENSSLSGTARFDFSALDAQARLSFRTACFHLLTLAPIICALLQLAIWTQFTLRGRHLDWVKKARSLPGHGEAV